MESVRRVATPLEVLQKTGRLCRVTTFMVDKFWARNWVSRGLGFAYADRTGSVTFDKKSEPQMKRRVSRQLMIIAATLFGSVAASAGPAAPRFDGRDWTVGHYVRNQRQDLTEYVLPGESVENWRELITRTDFNDPTHLVSLSAFVDQIHVSLAAGCPSLTWKVIKQEENAINFEWHDSGCGGFAAQFELDRIVVTSRGISRLAYAVKANEPPTAERQKIWFDILRRDLVEDRMIEAAGAPTPSAPTPSAPPTSKPSNSDPTHKELFAAIVKSGWICKAVTKAQAMVPKGPLRYWIVECSGGVKYSVLIDRNGAMTIFQPPE